MAANRRGFALVEGLVASAILALAITALFGLWAGMFRRIGVTRYAAQAGQLARAEAERAKVYGVDNLPMGTYSASTGTATWTGAYVPSTNAWTAGASSAFDLAGNRLASASTSGAALGIQSTLVDSNLLTTSGGYVFGLESRRTLVVTVTSVTDGSTILKIATILAPGGL